MELIILLCAFLLIFFIWYKEFITRHISFSKLLDVLTDFTCGGAIGNLGTICLDLIFMTYALGCFSY